MPAPSFIASAPEEVGLDSEKIAALFARAERDVAEGLLPAVQVAIARNGKIGAMRTFGSAVQDGEERTADDETNFVAMSATKAVVASAAWILMQEGKLSQKDRVVDYLPEYGSFDKAATTLEHLLAHTAGIPFARHRTDDWGDPQKLRQRFADWQLEHPPGEQFRYHLAANFLPIAMIVEQISGQPLAEFIRTRIAEPLGLPGLRLGLRSQDDVRVADLVWVGTSLTSEDYEAMGIPGNPVIAAIDEKLVLEFNERPIRELGYPAGGLITTAGDLALFYQALLADGLAHDGTEVWRKETLVDARRIRTGDLRDPVIGCRANRGLGIVIAGDDGQANMRSFGRTNSPESFGHPGFGGQCAWADPATGISFGYLTNGYDRNEIRMARRQVAVSSLAASCAPY